MVGRRGESEQLREQESQQQRRRRQQRTKQPGVEWNRPSAIPAPPIVIALRLLWHVERIACSRVLCVLLW